MRRLTNREVIAFCGDFYREMVAHFEDDPGEARGWELFAEQAYDELEQGPEGEAVGPGAVALVEAQRLTPARGITADEDSIRRVATALYATKLKVAETLGMRAEGDYSPDRLMDAFSIHAVREEAPEPLTSENLLAAWSAEKQPSEATLRSYRGSSVSLSLRELRRLLPSAVERTPAVQRDWGSVGEIGVMGWFQPLPLTGC